MCVGDEEEGSGGMAGASAAPRGTYFPCVLVHLPVYSNGAQRGGMNRPESGNTVVKLHLGSSACMDPGPSK